MQPSKAGRWLLGLGAVVAAAGSLTIEIALFLLLTPVRRDSLVLAAQVGIGMVLVGVLLMFLGKRVQTPGS